jgi:hypothetical protein
VICILIGMKRIVFLVCVIVFDAAAITLGWAAWLGFVGLPPFAEGVPGALVRVCLTVDGVLGVAGLVALGVVAVQRAWRASLI